MAFELFLKLGYKWPRVAIRPAFEPSNRGGDHYTTSSFFKEGRGHNHEGVPTARRRSTQFVVSRFSGTWWCCKRILSCHIMILRAYELPTSVLTFGRPTSSWLIEHFEAPPGEPVLDVPVHFGRRTTLGSKPRTSVVTTKQTARVGKVSGRTESRTRGWWKTCS